MRVAAAQINVKLGDPDANARTVEQMLRRAAAEHADLVVFPECALSGYAFESLNEAEAVAEKIPGESSRRLSELCTELGIAAVVGLLERSDDRLYNTAIYVDATGVVALYRKTHLLCMGVDRLVSPGAKLDVFETDLGCMGMLICYDLRFPEPARVLALAGAQIILNPANLPEGAEAYASFFNRSRACENRVFLVSSNRIGIERGFTFVGRSQIVDPRGRILAEAEPARAELLIADVNLDEADVKHVTNVPGRYEFDIVRDRRPDLYDRLCRPSVDARASARATAPGIESRPGPTASTGA
ncbi:MAG: carbon-nitrogen hydrolase family protein [Actinobacteria bacterium]|nr:carbon-nitrogen hydrolase family protein [Actinomycetota bacterium]